MDDGSKATWGGLLIHTHSFTIDEVQFLCNILTEKFDLKCHPQKKREGQWSIFIPKGEIPSITCI